MRWQGERESDNVEDQRRMTPGGIAIGGGAGLVIVVVALLLGVDPRGLLQQVAQNAPPAAQQQAQAPLNPHEEELKHFVAVVLASTEDVWTTQFQQMGRQYRRPKLVLFSGNVRSACGLTSAAVGPFYCPNDEKAYIDLSFYNELKNRFHAPGDFAQAYVIAHEIGHHVQNLMGIMEKVHEKEAQSNKAQANHLSVCLELQADFLAGVWAHHAQQMRHIIEQGDMEQAIRAASAIGDDKLQMQAQGYVVPDSFTHGTAAQRVKWFRRGFDTGDLKQGNTFDAADL